MRDSSAQIALPLVDHLVARVASQEAPVFVAIDGRSGSGKSTLAAALTRSLIDGHGVTTTVIEGDQFYAGGTAKFWDERSASEKAENVIDWRRQRVVLGDLREHGMASWHSFDWEAPDWDADRVPLATEPTMCEAGEVVVLEGAYSARPELHSLLDVRVLLDTPVDRRRRQLLGREGDSYREDWEARWSSAEDHYFNTIMPPNRFHMIL